MASTLKFVYVIVLSLVLGASYSLPIPRDLETVNLSISLSESDENKTERAFHTETVSSLDDETKTVPRFSTESGIEAFTVNFEANHIKRIKREMTRGGQKLCPSDKKEIGGRCFTPEQYDKIVGDD